MHRQYISQNSNLYIDYRLILVGFIDNCPFILVFLQTFYLNFSRIFWGNFFEFF
jgi:hypothetical protein